MKVGRKKRLTASEWASITSKGKASPVVRRIAKLARAEQKKVEKAQATEREADGNAIR